jgi:PPOX class probable F420-dependent enzyme
MDVDQVREFVKTNHRAVLATRRQSDGRPQLSPVGVGLGSDGRLLVSTRDTAIKTKNVRRDPHVSLCLLNDGFYGDWAQVDGVAEIVELPEAMDLLVEYYRAAAGEHPDWDDYRSAMVRERRVVLVIDVERVGPTLSG